MAISVKPSQVFSASSTVTSWTKLFLMPPGREGSEERPRWYQAVGRPRKPWPEIPRRQLKKHDGRAEQTAQDKNAKEGEAFQNPLHPTDGEGSCHDGVDLAR